MVSESVKTMLVKNLEGIEQELNKKLSLSSPAVALAHIAYIQGGADVALSMSKAIDDYELFKRAKALFGRACKLRESLEQ